MPLQKTTVVTIYKLTNKHNGKVYIGLTQRELRHRLLQHRRATANKKSVITKAIKKYGFDSFSVTIIGTYTDLSTAIDAEAYFIEFHNSLVPSGYNISAGGLVRAAGWKHTDEARAKIGVSGIGRTYTHTLEARQKISAAKRGRPSWNKDGRSPTKGMKFPGRTWVKDPVTGRRVWNGTK